MKRLIINKLIVISQSESRSLEVPFSKGLNIILGGNKTGKSSIIKSIFTTFGCECRHIEKDWKDIISTYILYFQYGLDQFCIVRENKKFQLFQKHEDTCFCILETEHFHEYSNRLMKLLGANMPCVSKDGKALNITPPLLFRFQYIDQDDGWNKIADSFSNVSYIKDWKKNTNKYVCGYLSDEYYILKAEVAKLTMERDELKKEFSYNQNFVNQISATIKHIETNVNPEDIVAELSELTDLAKTIKEQQFRLKTKMSAVENDIFIDQHKLRATLSGLDEAHKDIAFAMTQDEELLCPTCGAKYSNKLVDQFNISSDSAMAEKLISALNNGLVALANEINTYKEQYRALVEELQGVESKIRKSQELISYQSFYKNEGKQELYDSCLKQLESVQAKLDLQISQIAKLNEQVEALKFRTRSKEIRQEIESYCRRIAEIIAIPKTYIKLNDFVQTIEKTGSETPRIVYMYQSAMYLYNLDRTNSPFNFFVIDTPNQQGQDTENLKNIYQSLTLFLSDEGQVIVGTERETGCEDKASSVYKLTEKRRCLTQENYKEHQELLDILQKEAIRWVRDEFQKANQ